ncbi:zf-HC2 domain-containing protein [Geodermatophilus sp. DSM 44513]|uniref:anti-sigma factor family protein n=1 Tax=Geodermatophilus sp. DSM 44513 TaxID=1528104 RepID=UPI001412BE18|nr:zf-HC2 domain-containing protein [Geodermatophilus sp. DSM 44513]WNV73962.1 zf-HC2 domain-containing protein [Geodermatophilus sp. DSM 44513]
MPLRGGPSGPVECQDVVELATDLLEGDLDGATVVRVDDHLLSCAGCAEYVDQMRRTADALHALGRPEHAEPLGTDLRHRLMDAYRRYGPRG